MIARFFDCFLVFSLASIVALFGRALTRKIPFWLSLAVYIVVLGIGVFSVLTFTHPSLSCLDALVSIAIYLVLAIILALLMKIASVPLIEMWLNGNKE